MHAQASPPHKKKRKSISDHTCTGSFFKVNIQDDFYTFEFLVRNKTFYFFFYLFFFFLRNGHLNTSGNFCC